jgi:hypothetical protein
MRKLLGLLTAAILSLGLVAYAIGDEAGLEGQTEALLVKNSEGEDVGTIHNALVDPFGRIAFIILSVDDMGGGQKEIAVPIGAFSLNREKRSLVLDIGKEKLSSAPVFQLSDLGGTTFAENAYRFFGLMPAWSDQPQAIGQDDATLE